jgi:putative peptidoglycan lipid II flippase
LFFHGAFSADDVLRTREALVAYAIGLTGLILVKVLAPGFYARQNIRTPVRIALVSLLATQAMNLAFVGWIGHAGLALSIGLAACLNAGMLYRGLRQQAIYTPQPGWARFNLKLLIALLAMAGVLWLGMGQETGWLQASLSVRLGHLAWLVPLGASTYFATLWLLGFRLGDFKRRAVE